MGMEETITKYFEEVNNLFVEYIKILPNIELRDSDSISGRHLKLKTQLNQKISEFQTVEAIFFELQYMLYDYNQRNGGNYKKMLVSELILTPVIPNSTFLRGFIIKMEYQQ